MLIIGVMETQITMHAIASTFGCSPELVGNTPLLKSPHTLFLCHTETKLLMTGKISSLLANTEKYFEVIGKKSY